MLMNILTFYCHGTNGLRQKPLKFHFLSRWLQSDLMNALEKAKTQYLNDVA
ncbi:DNA-binding protein [Bartonella harrusi]|uniref:DNA-binding protein n=1 Tax=Bartonella harrusi TaxID=2961895 RepID=A0ABY5EUW5_9HYPH|nr:DNA-binding protein [Bartonella harrusi]UTO28288.1 DNA-binding protein [Bartonella harrusi]